MKGEIFMNIKITGKELKATESIKDYIEKKAERLEKYFTAEVDASVTIKTEGKNQVAEMYVKVGQDTFRAVTEHTDLYASIDKDIDVLEGQIRKAKTKKDKQNMTESIRMKQEGVPSLEHHETENEILKVTYYSIKPMGPEDAKLKLEEMPKSQFLAFINIDTGKVNIIYRLKDGKNFGIAEPEA